MRSGGARLRWRPEILATRGFRSPNPRKLECSRGRAPIGRIGSAESISARAAPANLQPSSPRETRHVFVIAFARDLRREAGWRLKNGRKRVGQGKPPGGELRYRCVRSRLGPRPGGKNKEWRAPASRRLVRPPRVGRGGEHTRAQAFGRSAVGADSRLGRLFGVRPGRSELQRPAAIVSPEFKEIKGWKIATPRANEPKGEWWSVSRSGA